MIDLISTTQVILLDAGYNVWLAEFEHAPIVCFEDGSLLGFCITFPDAKTLLEKWQSAEKNILARYAQNLRSAGEKAWNVYIVFATTGNAEEELEREIHWIEEDLNRTRKIALAGVTTRESLTQLLLPLLPLQQQPVIGSDDITERLKRRVRSIAPGAADAVFIEDIPAPEVVRLLEVTK